MRRVLGGLREWPVSARAAAGVLSALVVVFALTTVLSSRHHDRTRLRTASPPASTTTTSPSDTAFLTTVPAPTTSTSALKGAGPSTTTTAPGFRGVVVATSTSVAATRTTSTPATTSTTAGPADAYCRAAVTDPRPAAGAQETVNVTSTLPAHELSLVVHYRTGDITFPAKGQPPFTTDASGKITVNFDVSQGSKDYPVIVDVTFATSPATCETNFRPAT